MSCVALANAITKKKNIVLWNQNAVGMVNAMPASAAPMSSCIAVTHHRFVFSRSTNGLHSGFTTHGRASHPV